MRPRGKRTKGLEEAHPFIGMSQVNKDAAGVDIGAEEIIACVSGDGNTQIVKAFGNYTVDLQAIGKWLGEHRVKTVATAHAIARVVYRMLKYKVEYEQVSVEEYEKKYKEQQIKYMKKTCVSLSKQSAEVRLPTYPCITKGGNITKRRGALRHACFAFNGLYDSGLSPCALIDSALKIALNDHLNRS